MDEFLRQFLMFLAASADDPAPTGGGSTGDEAGAGGESTPSEDPQPPAPSEEELGEGGKKALQAERDARKQADKRVAELEDQLAQVGSANDTALQEAQEQAKKAQEDLAEATRNASRYKVAGRFGISTEVAEGEEKSQADVLLTGSTEEEMVAQAKIIAAMRQSVQDDALVDPTQGGGSGGGRQKVEYEPGTPRLAAAIDTQIQK